MANQSQESFQKHTSSSSSSSSVVVVVVPFPLQSHLNQLLLLSHVISSHNIPVHFLSSALHISQVKSRAIHVVNQERIQFHDFPTPHFLSPLPNDTKFQSHLLPSFEAFANLHESCRFPNTKVYKFHCVSSAFRFARRRNALGLKIEENIPWYEESLPPEFEAFVAREVRLGKKIKTSGHVYNTCRLIESAFLDFMLERDKDTHQNFKISGNRAIGHSDHLHVFGVA
ncbi:hypothetical protein TIFTF001_043749 [Ficus carica]|uniref:Glycosyltransferase N-terminal domain-containing protein n=1 Tax=Ficus carica TaxID=3494 RepID=A0AA87YVI2_FICCA|nr:hypothetical protein TIFTF001_043749 [Ficus carica]